MICVYFNRQFSTTEPLHLLYLKHNYNYYFSLQRNPAETLSKNARNLLALQLKYSCWPYTCEINIDIFDFLSHEGIFN